MKLSDAFPGGGGKFFTAKAFGDPLVGEIEVIRQEEIGGNNGTEKTKKPVLYLRRQKLGLVLSATVWAQLCELTGLEDSDDWPGVVIELYKTKTQFKGDMVDCIRVLLPSENRPKAKKAPKAPLDDDLSDVA